MQIFLKFFFTHFPLRQVPYPPQCDIGFILRLRRAALRQVPYPPQCDIGFIHLQERILLYRILRLRRAALRQVPYPPQCDIGFILR